MKYMNKSEIEQHRYCQGNNTEAKATELKQNWCFFVGFI